MNGEAEPLLSVITICYNQLDIEETCECIIAQTFQDFEWVVVDGGSTDETLQKLKKYQNRINLLISEKDNGRYHAMNKGIRLAKGKYLNFLNGGDTYFSENTLEEAINALKYRIRIKMNFDILYGGVNLIYQDYEITSPAPYKLTKEFFVSDNINHQSTFIRKSLFEKYGYYNEQTEIFGDLESWLLFLKNKCLFRRMDAIVANFKMDGISSFRGKQWTAEKTEIIKQFFTPQEMENIYFPPVRFFKKIFSMKEVLAYKAIRILGIKIKFPICQYRSD